MRSVVSRVRACRKILSSSASSLSSKVVDQRKVLVDDEVHERVEDEAGALGQKIRVASQRERTST